MGMDKSEFEKRYASPLVPSLLFGIRRLGGDQEAGRGARPTQVCTQHHLVGERSTSSRSDSLTLRPEASVGTLGSATSKSG